MPYDPAITLLGSYLKKTKTLIRKDTCTPVFITALFTVAKIQKQPKCPLIDEWLKKIYVRVYTHTHTHTHSGILLSHKNNEILPFVTTWIHLEGIMLSERSQTEKDK